MTSASSNRIALVAKKEMLVNHHSLSKLVDQRRLTGYKLAKKTARLTTRFGQNRRVSRVNWSSCKSEMINYYLSKGLKPSWLKLATKYQIIQSYNSLSSPFIYLHYIPIDSTHSFHYLNITTMPFNNVKINSSWADCTVFPDNTLTVLTEVSTCILQIWGPVLPHS